MPVPVQCNPIGRFWHAAATGGSTGGTGPLRGCGSRPSPISRNVGISDAVTVTFPAVMGSALWRPFVELLLSSTSTCAG